jgi:hypothetical protein
MATAQVVRPGSLLPAAGREIDGDALAAWFNAILTFLENPNIRAGNVLTSTTGSHRDVVLVGDVNQIIESLKTFVNTAAAAGGPRNVIRMGLSPASGTATDEDGVRIELFGDNDAGNSVSFGAIDLVFTDVSAGTEEARLVIRLMDGAAHNDVLEISPDAVYPSTDEAVGLGTETNKFGSSFAASLRLNNDGLQIVDNSGAFVLNIRPNEIITVDRVLSIITGDSDRELTISGDATISGTNTGDQTITLTGDVTGSGTGSFATTIANDAVTNAKLADEVTHEPTPDAIAKRNADGRMDAVLVSGISMQPALIESSVTIPSGYNALSAGPITIDDGITVTVELDAIWAIV